MNMFPPRTLTPELSSPPNNLEPGMVHKSMQSALDAAPHRYSLDCLTPGARVMAMTHMGHIVMDIVQNSGQTMVDVVSNEDPVVLPTQHDPWQLSGTLGGWIVPKQLLYGQPLALCVPHYHEVSIEEELDLLTNPNEQYRDWVKGRIEKDEITDTLYFKVAYKDVYTTPVTHLAVRPSGQDEPRYFTMF